MANESDPKRKSKKNRSERTALENLLTAFDQAAQEPPSDVAEFIRTRPPVGSLPLPWETWALINLMRYRSRQFWAKEIVFGKLLGGVRGFKTAIRKERFLEGYVPQQPEWSFRLDGLNGYCILVNRVTNERVGVGVTNYENADLGFDREDVEFDFMDRVIANDDGAGARLRDLHPSRRSLVVSHGRLNAMKVFEAVPEESVSGWADERLADFVIAHSDAVCRFCQLWSDHSQRLWLAALIGDWFAVSELAASADMKELAGQARQRAERCRTERLRDVTDMVAQLIQIDGCTGLPVPEWFHALNELDESKLTNYLRQAFTMRDAAICALCYIEERDDPNWCAEVYSLFKRALRGNVTRDDPKGQLFTPVSDEHPDDDDLLAVRCATYLAKHHYRTTEVIDKLADNPKALDETIVLALQYSPDRAMEILRRCMQSPSVFVIRQAVAILAIMGGPESEALCLAAMKRSDDPMIVAYCQMALYSMWGKEQMLFIHDEVRRLLKWARKKNSFVLLDSCDTRHLKKGDDVLAAGFLAHVEWLSRRMPTHCGSIADIGNASGGGDTVAAG